MFKWLKKLFIPHKGNDYKPHLFREAGTAVLFTVVVSLFIIAVSGRFILIYTDLTALVLPKVLVDYANDDRSAQNYRHLAISPTLEKAAQLKANDMAEKSYFAHKTPEGYSPWYWFQKVGYDFSFAGENLAVNFSDSVDVNKAWMQSPGHRANIMNSNFTEIGIATAEGFYQGRRTVFVVQLFGTPAEKETIIPKVVVPTTPKTQTKTTAKIATTSTVLSESVSSVVLAENGTNELYVSVEKKSAVSTTSKLNYSNFVEKIIMSPNKFLGFVYFAIILVLIIGLLTSIFIEIKKQHPRYILMGFGLLFIVLGLLYIYQYVLFAQISIV